MKAWMITFGLLLVVPVIGHSLLAQVKYEAETEIDAEAVPERARQFVMQIQPTKSDRWYREKSLEGTTIEVKLKKSGNRYSIKFSEAGALLDVEKEIKWGEVSEEAREEIEEQWRERYDRYRIEKIQLHFEDTEERLLRYMQTDDPDVVEEDYSYEIEVRIKEDGDYGLYEYLFDEEGESEGRRRIVTRQTDNMEF
jgi:hypothetical protein